MNDENFKKTIYEPYLEAWKIMKLAQHCRKRGTDEQNDLFYREVNRLSKAYPGNAYIHNLCMALLEAWEYILEENSKDEVHT